jgi:nitronate monooxygenase
LQKEQELGSAVRFEDIAAEVAGVYPRIMQEGSLDAGAWSCGLVAGLIRDIPSVQELIDRIMGDAHRLIGERLAAFGASA